MTRHTPIITALAGLLTLAAWSTANADYYQLTAKIPFAFTVNTTTLPAGSYLVQRVDGKEGMFLVRGARHGIFFVASQGAMSGDPALGARVVFNRYGDRYFLREVWAGRRGYPVPETTEERELTKAQDKVALLRVVVPIGEAD
jgi:hypothetical protein